jgi:S-adenosylmethionine decarboxylase
VSPHQARGIHSLVDLFGVEPARLADCEGLESILREVAQAAGARVLFARFHSFGNGLGVTGVVLLAESHISIHTWPEAGFAAADIFLCGQADPERALCALIHALAPVSHQVRQLDRGLGPTADLGIAHRGRAAA